MSPRFLAAFLAVAALATLRADEKKLSVDQRVELLRGLTAEYATAKVAIPKSPKNLEFQAGGGYDITAWGTANRQFGTAARVGDILQVTKVDIGHDKITLELNGGSKLKRKWSDHIEVGMGGSTRPINQGQATNAPAGTTIVVNWGTPLPPLQANDVKKILAPILDFENKGRHVL